VAICSYNGSLTIRDTLEALQHLEYPDYEVIVVDDGSSDHVAEIAKEYGVRVIIHAKNQGLSSARNTALEAAIGEIITYIDDDAYPDPHWLTYLAATFLNGDYAGVGGPNLPPPGDGWIADCVANAPGGPIHVLLSDQEAEHIPGCNMAYWKSHLQAVGGFDPRFRAAGDDVDICWQLQKRGQTSTIVSVTFTGLGGSMVEDWCKYSAGLQSESIMEPGAAPCSNPCISLHRVCGARSRPCLNGTLSFSR
jgi:glycosyltransferase involved in cell wall biosynthesis